MKDTHAVEIVEYETGKVEKRLTYTSERMAEKAEKGVERNLDHERFFTRIVPIESEAS